MTDPIFLLCDQVRQTAFNLHCYLRPGHLEKVYENGLANRLRKQGLRVVQQHPLAVFDEDGTELGSYYADMLINDILLVELKAVRTLADEHIAQLLGYLRTCRVEHGLLLNFGGPKLQAKKLAMLDNYR